MAVEKNKPETLADAGEVMYIANNADTCRRLLEHHKAGCGAYLVSLLFLFERDHFVKVGWVLFRVWKDQSVLCPLKSSFGNGILYVSVHLLVLVESACRCYF